MTHVHVEVGRNIRSVAEKCKKCAGSKMAPNFETIKIPHATSRQKRWKNKKNKLKIVNKTVKWFREGGRTVGSGVVKTIIE